MTKPFPQNLRFTKDTVSKAKHLGNSFLGKGGSGNVHLMHHNSDKNIIIAMKTVPLTKNSQLVTIMDEIQLHQSLKHTNIICMHGFQFLPEKVLIFMEYASKGDLYKFLKLKKLRNVLNTKTKLKIFIQCVNAIGYMHSRGKIHRDIKPENVLLTDNFDARVCDFGWAIREDHPKRRKSLCGTTEYMAPEIVNKESQTTKIDVWALGEIIFLIE